MTAEGLPDSAKVNRTLKLLYVTMGFAPVGIRRRYYRDNDEDAIVMVRRLGQRKST